MEWQDAQADFLPLLASGTGDVEIIVPGIHDPSAGDVEQSTARPAPARGLRAHAALLCAHSPDYFRPLLAESARIRGSAPGARERPLRVALDVEFRSQCSLLPPLALLLRFIYGGIRGLRDVIVVPGCEQLSGDQVKVWSLVETTPAAWPLDAQAAKGSLTSIDESGALDGLDESDARHAFAVHPLQSLNPLAVPCSVLVDLVVTWHIYLFSISSLLLFPSRCRSACSSLTLFVCIGQSLDQALGDTIGLDDPSALVLWTFTHLERALCLSNVLTLFEHVLALIDLADTDPAGGRGLGLGMILAPTSTSTSSSSSVSRSNRTGLHLLSMSCASFILRSYSDSEHSSHNNPKPLITQVRTLM